MKQNIFLLHSPLTLKHKLLRYFKKSTPNANSNHSSSFSNISQDSRIDEGFQQHNQQSQRQQKYKTNKTCSLITNGSILHSLTIYPDKAIGIHAKKKKKNNDFGHEFNYSSHRFLVLFTA